MKRSRIARLGAGWHSFWFASTSPTNLAVCRIAFFGGLLGLYRTRDVSAWSEVSRAFWMPTFFFRILRIPVLPRSAVGSLQTLWKVMLAFSCVGLFTRPSTLTAFVLGSYLLGLPHNFGKVHHGNALLVFIQGILALSRCGDAWSIDRLHRTVRRRGDGATHAAAATGEYTWPIRLVQLLISLAFFGAGVSKMRRSGLAWITSDNLAVLLVQRQYDASSTPSTSWGPFVARYGRVCRLLAAATVAIELSYPLALVRREARWIVLPAACAMLGGIRALLGPSFWPFILCHLFWVPWDRVGVWLAPRLSFLEPTRRPGGAR